jgi:hypothetical protein
VGAQGRGLHRIPAANSATSISAGYSVQPYTRNENFAQAARHGTDPGVRLLILIRWLWPVQPAKWPQRRGACRLPRKAGQRRCGRARGRRGRQGCRYDGRAQPHAALPPEACRGPRVDDQRRTVPVPTSRRGASLPFAFGSVLSLPEMELANPATTLWSATGSCGEGNSEPLRAPVRNCS